MSNHQHDDYHDLGLNADLNMWLRKPLARRRVLKLGAAGIGLLMTGCVLSQESSDGCLTAIPTETEGPYPADGSRQVNVLERSGIVRSDIKTSLETGTTAAGVPLTIDLNLFSASGDCGPLAGYAIYLWHCDRDGNYSMYSNGVTEEDYLRGVQATDSAGKATFSSIFPACYSGRWPHIHFEIYPSLELATNASNKLHTSQLAIPEEVCDAVYETAEGYDQSIRNLEGVSLSSDNVFSDGVDQQMATVTGSVSEGYSASLNFAIEV